MRNLLIGTESLKPCTVFGSVRNIEEHISAYKRIVLQNLKTIENYEKLQNNKFFLFFFSQLTFKVVSHFALRSAKAR